MKIHEYQARQIFAARGIPVGGGEVATSAAEAGDIARRIGGPVMVKAQVHAGGRGKAGAIKRAETPEQAAACAGEILGMLVKGLPVRRVLVTAAVEITSEAYAGIVLDRAAWRPVVMVCAAGGVDIEEVAARDPAKIHRLHVDPVFGLRAYQARVLAAKLYDDPGRVRQAADIFMKLYEVFYSVDASLVEINPLAVTASGTWAALDAKINIDDNGLYRQPDITEMRDLDAEDPSEIAAREAGLSYVKLDGNIGCMVNGAGLAMATMDLVKRYGGEPANFLDIGGSSSPGKVVTALDIILSSPNVEAVLINIFGGITRCDDVARGIVEAFERLRPAVPVVIRLTGTNEEEAARILEDMNLPCAGTLDEAVKMAIHLSKTPAAV